MTTYCLDPNQTWLAVYNLNTGTMPTNNVIFSHITANLSSSATSIAITNGEGELFTQGMVATIEQLNDEGKATAREVVLITSISTDTLTIARGYEKCVIDDTATPKLLGDTPQTFTSGARISVYVSKALLNGVQTTLSQVSGPCNTQVSIGSQAIKTCMDENYECRRALALRQVAKCNCGDSVGFGDGSDGDCIIDGDVFLDSTRTYNFTNLIINNGACLRFIESGVPKIYVSHCFVNNGIIDLRGGCYVGTTTASDCKLGTISNRGCLSEYNTMCYGCGGLGFNGTCGSKAGNGGNANVPGCSGPGIGGTKAPDACTNATNGTDGGLGYGGGGGGGGGGYYNRDYPKSGCTVCPSTNGCNANGYNGGDGGCPGNGVAGNPNLHRIGGGGGGGGGYWTGNGGNGQTAGSTGGTAGAGQGGNGGIWGRGGDSLGNNCCNMAGTGRGGNGYIGGKGAEGSRGNTRTGRGGDGGFGVVCGGNGGTTRYTTAGNGGKAITNVYGLILRAYSFQNNVICAKGGNGGNGGNSYGGACGAGGQSGNGGCGGNGGCIAIGYSCLVGMGTIDVSKGLGGCKGVPNACGGTPGIDGADGTDGILRFCKIF